MVRLYLRLCRNCNTCRFIITLCSLCWWRSFSSVLVGRAAAVAYEARCPGQASKWDFNFGGQTQILVVKVKKKLVAKGKRIKTNIF